MLCGLWSCGAPSKREPIPQIRIDVQADGIYFMEGQQLTRTQIHSRLSQLADRYRRSITGTCRAYVIVSSNIADTGDRVHNIVNYCMSVGLDKVQIGR